MSTIKWVAEVVDDEDRLAISELMVLKSNAGYYFGHMCKDLDIGLVEPYSRVSGYFDTEEEANAELEIRLTPEGST